MMIGNFKADDNGGYSGQLDALGLTVSAMTICPVKDKQGDGPDFIIIGCGEWIDDDLPGIQPSYEVGTAWKKISLKRQVLFVCEAGRPDLGSTNPLPTGRGRRWSLSPDLEPQARGTRRRKGGRVA